MGVVNPNNNYGSLKPVIPLIYTRDDWEDFHTSWLAKFFGIKGADKERATDPGMGGTGDYWVKSYLKTEYEIED